MKKSQKKELRNLGLNRNVQEVLKNFELEMRMTRKVPKAANSREAGAKKRL